MFRKTANSPVNLRLIGRHKVVLYRVVKGEGGVLLNKEVFWLCRHVSALQHVQLMQVPGYACFQCLSAP